MNIEDFVRKDIHNLEPYKPITSNWDIKLDANESPYDVPDQIKEEIWAEVKKNMFARYYDPTSEKLREALAAYTGAEKEQIIVGNGADEMISTLLLAFGGSGREVIIPTPTFPIYKTFTVISGARPIEIPLKKPKGIDEIWEPDYEGIKARFSKTNPQILVICYPNNPTGNYFSDDKIIELIEGFNGIVVIDEAYYEFGGKSFVPLINKYKNLAVIRTFSKAFCLAGLRIGYMVANEDIIEEIYKVKLPYNVSLFSQTAGQVLLKYTHFMEEVKENIIRNREYLYSALKSIGGLTPYPSEGNFILTRFSKGRDEVYNGLRGKRISIRKLEGEALKDCLRISVGSREDMDRMILEMKRILEGIE
jgi:histidinol-phosphate aminotransferase